MSVTDTARRIRIELWLCGPLARYGGEANQGSHAQLQLELPAGVAVQKLLNRLELPPEEKGITFINRQLSDMPGLAADRDRELVDGDRVAIFHTRSMWPFQYRHDAATSPELQQALERRPGELRHSYDQASQEPTE
jgi:hypothetical protein